MTPERWVQVEELFHRVATCEGEGVRLLAEAARTTIDNEIAGGSRNATYYRERIGTADESWEALDEEELGEEVH